MAPRCAAPWLPHIPMPCIFQCHGPVPPPSSLKAHPLCLQYAELNTTASCPGYVQFVFSANHFRNWRIRDLNTKQRYMWYVFYSLLKWHKNLSLEMLHQLLLLEPTPHKGGITIVHPLYLFQCIPIQNFLILGEWLFGRIFFIKNNNGTFKAVALFHQNIQFEKLPFADFFI